MSKQYITTPSGYEIYDYGNGVRATPAFNSRSKFLVYLDGDGSNSLGSVYCPSGRKWASVFNECGDWIASTLGADEGVYLLAARAAVK